MKIGKLEWEDLKRIINNRGAMRDEVRVRSSIGEDCSIVNFGDYECVISTDPITGANENLGKIAVNINCNDIASCGVNPLGILVTILVPPTSKIEEIEDIMKEIDEECKLLNVEILGGHTEVTDAVNRIVVSCTVIGKTESGKAVLTGDAKEGDDIIVTKQLCLEGTSIIVNDCYEKIKDILTEEEINEGKDYSNFLSVVKEGKIAGEFGVNSMHDITEGGILGALWEIAEGSNVGFEIYKNNMPISNVTMKLCEFFNIDPLKLISSGSMLITCKNGKELIQKLKNNGISARIVGKINKSNKILIEDNIKKTVYSPKQDDLFKVYK